MDRELVVGRAKELLSRPDLTVVGANLQYELEGLDSLGISIAGRLLDVQVAEALIDEEQASGYSLEAISLRHLGTPKNETLLRDACDAYGLKEPKSSLWKLPAKYVGPYAEYDANCVLRILKHQLEKISAEHLEEIFTLESKILPLLWQMRKRGVPVNLDAAQILSKDLERKEAEIEMELMKSMGFLVDVWKTKHLQQIFARKHIQFPTTELGNPSFTGEFLQGFSDPDIQRVHQIRTLSKMRRDFVDGWVLKHAVKGRIHPQWKQLASDDGGTRTGRMACANPNAQQVPAGKFRTTGKVNDIGRAIRALFVSDTGHWAKFDYKQQEPRILTHFANLCGFTGAPLAAMAYQSNKEMDFYQYIVESAGIDRRVAKDMYLGLCYGMGIKKLCAKLGKSVDDGKKIIDDFNLRVPFVKEIAESCERSAATRGYVKTLCGRRRHFNRWEPIDGYKRRTDNGEVVFPLPLREAEERWPNVKLVRADTRKALNALIQGSAADMVKVSLLKVHEECEVLPYLAVHDELDYGVSGEAEAGDILRRLESSVNMTVPIYADMKIGRHWE